MKLRFNQPVTLTQDDAAVTGILKLATKGEDGLTLTVLIPKRQPAADTGVLQGEPGAAWDSLSPAKPDLEGSFILDLSSLPAGGEEPREVDDHTAELMAERLADLTYPYSRDTVTKARQLVRGKKLELVKSEPQTSWFNVEGSTLYVTKITSGEDFTYAECSCPNGMHRGGEAICYHSVAARVLHFGLESVWLDEQSAAS